MPSSKGLAIGRQPQLRVEHLVDYEVRGVPFQLLERRIVFSAVA
jgi:hypothetical protein